MATSSSSAARIRPLAASLLLLCLGCGGVPAQTTGTERIAAADLMATVTELASPRYEGRGTGTAGGRLARAYLRDAFAQIGLEPAGTEGYEQPFRFTDHDDAANVIGRVPGTDPAASAIVITAHYDHDGVKEGQIYPGADDNASGVAALLAIARYVAREPLRHPIIIAALDAEELGLQGAKAFLAQPPIPPDRIGINVNLDMLSRNDRNEIYAAGTYHSPWLQPLLEEAARRSTVTLRFGHDRPKTNVSDPDDWTLESDHGEFHKAGIPFVYFGVEDHPDYHKPTDTADKIDPAFFRNVVEMVLESVVVLDRSLDQARVGATAARAAGSSR